MKRFFRPIALFTALLLVAAGGVQAQSYTITSTTGTGNNFDLAGTGASTIASLPLQDGYSAVQTLPFSFTFFGQQVTDYVVSDNGYLTFETSGTSSEPMNTALPDTAGPNNAIYAFWDDIELVMGQGSADEIKAWTIGTAPNRIHIVEWFSATPSSGGFVYAAIRLYECGDFDVILPYGNPSGPMTGTVGAEDATGANGVQVSGSPSLDYPSATNDPNDDVVYHFASDAIANDASVVELLGGDNQIESGSQDITFRLKNNAGTAINSVEVSYSVDGGAPVTGSLTSLNVTSQLEVDLTHPTPFSFQPGNAYEICVWVESVNGQMDDRMCNDTLCFSVLCNLGVSSPKRVMVEQGTGAWCQFCPDGAVVVQSILDGLPDGDAFAVANHNGDAMTYPGATDIQQFFAFSGYPTGMVDRRLFAGEDAVAHSRGSWSGNAATAWNDYTPAEVNVYHTWSPAPGNELLVQGTITAEFSDYAIGPFAYHVLVSEDSVTGTGSGYDQVNFYNSQSGHPYSGAGNPIVGYNHRNVLRANPLGTLGDNNHSIPSVAQPDSVYTYDFSFTVDPAQWDTSNIEIIGFLSFYDANDNTKNEIINVNGRMFNDTAIYNPTPTSLPAELMADTEVKLYPNPSSGQTFLKVNLFTQTDVAIDILNLNGQRVAQLPAREHTPGSHLITLPTAQLPNGVYMVRTRAGDYAQVSKLVIQR